MYDYNEMLEDDYEEKSEQNEINKEIVRNYLDSLTEEEFNELIEYEYYKEWILRDDELDFMGIDEFEKKMKIQRNGLTDEDLGLDEEDE